jgi:hypothetical protein
MTDRPSHTPHRDGLEDALRHAEGRGADLAAHAAEVATLQQWADKLDGGERQFGPKTTTLDRRRYLTSVGEVAGWR